MSDEVTLLYSASFGQIEPWRVESRTAKTFAVVNEKPHFTWRRTVRAADIGTRWHRTERAALEYVRDELQRELEQLQYRVQTKRSALGQIEAQLRKVERSA